MSIIRGNMATGNEPDDSEMTVGGALTFFPALGCAIHAATVSAWGFLWFAGCVFTALAIDWTLKKIPEKN